MIQLYKQSPAQVVIIKNQTCKRLTLVLFDACYIDMTVRFIHHWSSSQNDSFHSKQKSKVTKPEKYTLDTLLTLAFQKRCYINIFIICIEGVNFFGQRKFFNHKLTKISKIMKNTLQTLYINVCKVFLKSKY